MDSELTELGWRPFFQQQMALDELESLLPARVTAQHRSGVELQGSGWHAHVPLGGRWFQGTAEERPTVGDWVLAAPTRDGIVRLLERESLFSRVLPGHKVDLQLIAANVDVMFVVTSCNDEFNVSRLERYLSLAFEAHVQPVVVLTKADLAGSADGYREAAQALHPSLGVELVDARDLETLTGVLAWCRRGQTITLVGSSGVGKSTLANTLAGQHIQETGGIREDDAKGRHTTSHRSLHVLPRGGVLVDCPGMRELALADTEAGVSTLFADIEEMAANCRFGDCRHESEPGCAVQAAIASGAMDARRLVSFHKLLREERRNTESVAEQRHRNRQFSKAVRRHLAENPKFRN